MGNWTVALALGLIVWKSSAVAIDVLDCSRKDACADFLYVFVGVLLLLDKYRGLVFHRWYRSAVGACDSIVVNCLGLAGLTTMAVIVFLEWRRGRLFAREGARRSN